MDITNWLNEPWNKNGRDIYSERSILKMRLSHIGKRLSNEQKQKISLTNKNRIVSEETRRKISNSNKGKKRSNDLKEYFRKLYKGKTLEQKFGKEESDRIKKLISISSRKRKLSEDHKKKLLEATRNRIFSKEAILKMSKSHSGEKSNFWKGGIASKPYSKEFTKHLKTNIRARDNFICQLCNVKPLTKLNVHHIDYNKENCDKNNLISLCKSCHSKTQFNRNKWIKIFKEKMKGGVQNGYS